MKHRIVTALLPALVLLAAPVSHTSAQEPGTSEVLGEGSLVHDGLERTFLVHVPRSRDPSVPAPLVIALHGGGGRGRGMERLTGFSDLADQEGFIVVYPDGVDKHWNDGRDGVDYRAQREAVDDVGFISALIDHLEEELNIDTDRVFVTGMSNGALIAHRIALEIPDRVAAIAPVEGTLLEDLATASSPSTPVSVLIIKGLDAPLFENRSKRLTASDTARYWAAHDGCSATPTVTWQEDRDPEDGTRVRREAYDECRGGTEVILYGIEGGGHTWPGGWQYYPEEVIGKTSRDIDATRIIWDFFTRHTRPRARGGAMDLELTTEVQAELPDRPEVVGDYKPNGVVTGDWNRDGHLDFAAAHAFRHQVSVFLGDGTGRFAQQVTVAAPRRPIGMTRGDFNGDGHVDLAVTSYNRAGLAVLLGDGRGDFSAGDFALTGNSPQAVTAADWNADGRLDVAVSNRNDHTVSLLMGGGSAGFSAASTYRVGQFPAGLTAGDWNGDGRLDLAVVNHFSHIVSILLGDGRGHFRPAGEVEVGLYPGDIDTADLDRDGRADLVVVNVRDGDLSILLGRGDGTFEALPRLVAGLAPAGLAIADLDGDAASDIAVVMRDEPRLVVFRNRLADLGRFHPGGELATCEVPIDVVDGDFDEDGRQDLLVFTPSDARFLVFLNRTPGELAR